MAVSYTHLPVIGANVLEKGTTNGTVTDADGRFSLDISRNATLQISYLGYNTQNIVVGNQTTFAVKLSEDSEALDAVSYTHLFRTEYGG